MSKRKKWEKKLLEDYESGKVIQVNNGVDNKGYFKSLKRQNETTEEPKSTD